MTKGDYSSTLKSIICRRLDSVGDYSGRASHPGGLDHISDGASRVNQSSPIAEESATQSQPPMKIKVRRSSGEERIKVSTLYELLLEIGN